MAIPRNLANLANQLDTSGNPPKVQVGDSSVVVTDTGSNGTITFTTDNSERARFTSAGLGIAVTPSAWTVSAVLQLSTGNVRGSTGSAGFGSNWFFDGASKYISTGFASDNYQQDGDIVWRNAPSGTAGGTITWSERARIPAAGGFQCVNSISVGNATPTTSGAGITFPATQSASSNANTLDDYEEGTWTPATATSSLTTAYAIYTKIGRFVCLAFDITIAANASTTGISITGVPFAANSSGSFTGTLIADNFNVLNVNPFINAATTSVGFMISSTTGGGRNTVAHSQVNASGVLRAVVCYMTD